MSCVIKRLATVLLATASSVAVASAGSLPQGQAAPAVSTSAAATGTQLQAHVTPVAFWRGLERGGHATPQDPGTAGPLPVISALVRPGNLQASPAPAVPKVRTPVISAPMASHTATAMHVPPLPTGQGAVHVPPLPTSLDAVHVPPLPTPKSRTEAAPVRPAAFLAPKPLAVTYVIPGPAQASGTGTAPSSSEPGPSGSAAHGLALEKRAAAASPLPMPPPPVEVPKVAAKVSPSPLSVKRVRVIKVADKSNPTASAGDSKKDHASEVMKHLAVGVGGGILVRLPAPASTVFAADPKVARVEAASPTAIFVIGMKRGATNLIATNQAGDPIAQYVVEVGGSVLPHRAPVRHTGSVSHGPSFMTGPARNMQSAINQIVPGANLVKVKKVGSAYLLTGVVATPEIAQEAEAIGRAYAGKDADIMDKLEVLSSIQVNVRVRVAEVSRTMVRQLGLNWQALGHSGKWRFGLLTGAAATGVISPLTPLGLATTVGGTPLQIGGGYSSGGWSLDSVIDALAGNQLATILAEPNLTVESGHKADFLSGGEYPVPVPSASSNTISIEYKQYGVSLSVTPTVIAPNKISLKVEPSVSQLSTAGAISVAVAGGSISVPALTVRKARTVVQLGSGQAFAIAGLLQSTTSQTGSGLPGADGIPVLGALFRNNQYQRTADELVIIVTPYLVNPVSSPSDLHAPTDGFVPATDLQQILYGKQMQGNDKQPSSTAPLDAGFLME